LKITATRTTTVLGNPPQRFQQVLSLLPGSLKQDTQFFCDNYRIGGSEGVDTV